MKIPLLPENVGKRNLNYLGTLGTLERVTTVYVLVILIANYGRIV